MDPGDDTDTEDPQSWNKYAYVRNNPLKTIDPRGTAGEPSQAQLDQMAATGIQQQLEPQRRAMEAAANAEIGKGAVEGVCAAAPEIGDRAATATTALIAMSPATGGASLEAATITGGVALAGHGVAALCEPSPENVTEVVVDVLGMGAEYTIAKVAMNAPGARPLIKAGLTAVTGEVVAEAARPVVKQATTALMCP